MTRVRLLTSAVIGMGVLILSGLVVLVVGVVNKADEATSRSVHRSVQTTSRGAAATALRAGSVNLRLPAGAKVLHMSDTRSGLAILVALPDGNQEIYIVPTQNKSKPLRISISKNAGQ